jgi:hypothetical protein
MRMTYKVGFSLSLIHAAFGVYVIVFPSFDRLERVIGGSVYAPLFVFDGLGLPVFSEATSWGFSDPSGLGYVLSIGFWVSVWLLVGRIIEFFWSRR